MILDVLHQTRFAYSSEVLESAMEVRLQPRDDPDQRRLQFSLEVQPATRAFSFVDGFGNTGHFFTVPQGHTQLTVTARSRVETRLANPFAAPHRPIVPYDPVELWPFMQFAGPVQQPPEVRALAAQFGPTGDEQVLDALQALMTFVHTSFAYEADVTDVRATVADVLTLRKGVCQDFAHLMISVCRAMGIPARYVSGYICSTTDHLARGQGASHAWCEALVPGYGWRGFDPTNNVLAADLHVKVGYGRDYHDVPPTRGVYRGTAGQTVDVRVKTVVIDGDTL